MGLMLAAPSRSVLFYLLIIVGLSSIAVASVVSNTFIEETLGREPHSLSWGPALFRALLTFHGLLLIGAALVRKQSPSGRALPPIGRTNLIFLAALSVMAILLRIPSLNSCLWLDEVLTMVRFARPPVALILTSFPDQNQHMFYSLLAHASMSIFGSQPWALRLPSVVFGVASIWALFLLGRRLIGAREAFLVCALMTVSYHHIWFSQNARGYMGLLFFTILATWLWLEAMDLDRWSIWLAYSVCVALGLWIHMTMLFVVMAHAGIFLILWLRSGRDLDRLGRAVIAFTLCCTLALQVYALALPEFLRTAASEKSTPSEWTNPFWVVIESLRSLRVGFAGAAVVLCGGVLVATGWIDMFRREQPAAWAMILPAIMGGGSMLLLGHNLWPRFFFFCMGFGLLIVIHGALQLPRFVQPFFRTDARWTALAGFTLAGLMILASLTTVPRCYALPKQDFTGARDFVERQRAPGEPVIVIGLAAHAYSQYYAPQWAVAETSAELAALRTGNSRAFVVYTLPIELRAVHPEIWKTVQADFDVERVFPGTLGGGEVYVCRERSRTAEMSR